jgi:hypothetical protein
MGGTGFYGELALDLPAIPLAARPSCVAGAFTVHEPVRYRLAGASHAAAGQIT